MHGVVAIHVFRVHFFHAILFFFLSGVCSGQTRRNVTVDSSSPWIRYTPSSSWRRIVGDLDAGGEHMMTQDPNAYALINSTFVSYWIISARWPYRVRTQHTIDDNRTFVVDLQDHTVPDAGVGSASKASSIVARYIGTSELRHTIRISVPPRERYAVIDRLVFEVEDSSPSTRPAKSISTQIPTSVQMSTSFQATSSTAAPTESPLTSGESLAIDKERKLTIILGTLGPFLALFSVLVLVYLYFHRRAKTKPIEVEDVSPLPFKGMAYDTTDDSIRVSRAGSHFTAVIGPYLPYTPPRQLDDSPGKPTTTHPGSTSISFSPDRMVRATHRPLAF